MEPAELKRRLVRLAAQRYRRSGRFAFHFARGKLAGDPVYMALLRAGLLSQCRRIVDLGCGQGLLAAWLDAARECDRRGEWCAAWPAAPRHPSVHGIELMAREVARARCALGAAATIEHGDIRAAGIGASDAVVILDVLHYLDPASQEAVLARARAALAPPGVLLLRVGDAGGGLRFRISLIVDQAVLLLRGHGWVRLHARRLADWIALLDRLGFRADARPMSAGTPFANVLLVAYPR